MILPLAQLAPLACAVLLRCAGPAVAWPTMPPAPALSAVVALSGRAPALRSPLPAETPVVPPRPRESDRWFAEDKLKHFFVSFALGSIGYGTARAVGLRHGAAIGTASGGAIAVGIGKELHDRTSGGDASLRDLTWDVLGVAAAAGVSAETR